MPTTLRRRPRPQRHAAWSLAAALAGFVAVGALVGPAAGRLGLPGIFDSPAVSHAELAELRGGFSFAGVELSFGAEIRTLVDGRVALETRLVPTGSGTWIHAGGSPGLPGLVDPEGGFVDTASLPPRLADAIRGGSGIVVNDSQGLTAILHQLPSGAPGSLIVNEATGRTVSQDIRVDIGVQNYGAIADAVSQARIVRSVP